MLQFRSQKDLPAAQAADLFAWERAAYNATSIRRPSMVYLKEKMPDGMRGLDGKWEKRSMDQAFEEPRYAQKKRIARKAQYFVPYFSKEI